MLGNKDEFSFWTLVQTKLKYTNSIRVIGNKFSFFFIKNSYSFDSVNRLLKCLCKCDDNDRAWI